MSNSEFNIVKRIVIDSLEDLKTLDIVCLDMKKKSNFTDLLLVGTGTSSTHIKAISNEIIENLKKNGYGNSIRGLEVDVEWVLIDLYDIVINIMLKETREFYGLEKLWSDENNYKSKITSA
tara:strand:+ start:3181 stop:3543 length:363 start_codon:yes stop_codon:yes gene_type:complete